MSDKKPHPAVVGAFVIGAIALLILAALAIGGRGLFERKLECVAYFDENIGGLDVGAPVEYEGVRIGTVTGVRIEFDLPTHRFYRPIRFQIEPSRISADSTFNGSPGDLLSRLVTDHGLRAQLANQSLLTGKLKITLGNHPDTPATLLARDPGLLEVPTTPSPLAAVTGKLADLPFADIVTELRDAVSGLSALVQSVHEKGTVAHLDESLQKLGTLFTSINDQVQPLAGDGGQLLQTATATLEDIRATLKAASADIAPIMANLNATSGNLAPLFDPSTPAGTDLPSILSDLRDASRSLRLFLDYLEQHPEALLSGKAAQQTP